MRIRQLNASDFLWLKDFDCTPLAIERDSIYLFFCFHFSTFSYVAVDEAEEVLGFVLSFLPAMREIAYVHFLFVRSDHRRQGIGAALMSATEIAVEKAGAKRLLLYTIRAKDFYSRLGFEVDMQTFGSEITEYVLDSKGALPMSKSLISKGLRTN